MNLVFHLARADVQRFTPALAIWCAIAAAAGLLHGVQPFADNPRMSELIGFLAVVMWIGGLLVMFGLTAQVMQADPLIGTNAFWLTRPISALSLLGAKVVVIGMVVALMPVAVEIVLMVAYDVKPATIGMVAIQAMVVQVFWIFIAMSYATLTPGVAQFFLLCGTTPLALALALFFLEFAVRLDLMDSWPTPSAFEHTRAGIVFVLMTIAAAAGLLLTAYRTRSRSRAIAVGLALMVLALLMPEFVPRSSASNVGELPRWANDVGPLGVDGLSFRVEPDFRSNGPVLQGHVLTGDFPANWSATIAVKDESLSFDGSSVKPDFSFGDGSSIWLDAPAVWKAGARESSTVAALKSVLGVEFVRGLPSGGIDSAKLFGANGRTLNRLAITSARFRATVRLTFVERSVAAILPLQRGSSFNDGARRLSIVDVHSPQRGYLGARLTVRESIALSVFHPEPELTFEAYLRNNRVQGAVYGEVPFRDNRGDGFTPSMLMPVPIVNENHLFGFRAAPYVYLFPANSSSDGSLQIDGAWLNGAELVIVAVRRAGSIERVLEIPSVPVPARGETP